MIHLLKKSPGIGVGAISLNISNVTYDAPTKDLDGNLVGSGDSIRWNIFPSAKYVTIEKSDSTIFGGT